MHMVGTSSVGSHSLQTGPTHQNGPTLVTTTGKMQNLTFWLYKSVTYYMVVAVFSLGAPRANNSATFSNMHMAGTSSVGSHSLLTQENEATSKMQTAINNEAKLKIAQEAVKGGGDFESS